MINIIPINTINQPEILNPRIIIGFFNISDDFSIILSAARYKDIPIKMVNKPTKLLDTKKALNPYG